MADGFGLGDLVFMVRKDQILTAAVDIEGEEGLVHRRTFDMPARAPFAPGTRPGRFPGFGAFPESEVQIVFFFFAGGHASASAHIVEVAPREFAIGLIGANAEINVAVRGGIGVAFVD